MKSKLDKIIDATGLLSKSQKTIIKYIASLGIEKKVTSHSIQNYTKASKQAVNSNLNLLIKRRFLNREKDRIYMYYLNKEKLGELEEEYKNHNL